jgi:hypothetical protein
MCWVAKMTIARWWDGRSCQAMRWGNIAKPGRWQSQSAIFDPETIIRLLQRVHESPIASDAQDWSISRIENVSTAKKQKRTDIFEWWWYKNDWIIRKTTDKEVNSWFIACQKDATFRERYCLTRKTQIWSNSQTSPCPHRRNECDWLVSFCPWSRDFCQSVSCWTNCGNRRFDSIQWHVLCGCVLILWNVSGRGCPESLAYLILQSRSRWNVSGRG